MGITSRMDQCSSLLRLSILILSVFTAISSAIPWSPVGKTLANTLQARDEVVNIPANYSGNGCTLPGGLVLPNQTFYIFPDNYQPESIKQRENGALLVTINSYPLLYQIDPTKNQTGDVLFRFNNYTSLFGLVESGTPDVFFLIANNFTGNPNFWGIGGTNSIWVVNMTGVGMEPGTAQGRKTLESVTRVSKVVDIPDAELLDGLTIINKDLNLLITGDAQKGTLWLIDAARRNATMIMQHESLLGTSQDPNASLAHVGINGVRYYSFGQENRIYWTNTAKGQLWYVPIDPVRPGKITVEPTLVESVGEGAYLDDFTFDQVGNAYISEPLKGLRFRPATAPLGKDSSTFVNLFNVNSNTYGRLPEDKCTLYVTANGRVNSQSPAPMNIPPLLAKVDISPFGVCQLLPNAIQQQSPSCLYPGSATGTTPGR